MEGSRSATLGPLLPHSPMPEFLTITQAAQQTGRSASSIRRRIIYPILENDQHPDRSHIEPSVEEVQRLRMKGENFAWRVSRELLDRHGPSKQSAELPTEKLFVGVGDEPTLREVVNLLLQRVFLAGHSASHAKRMCPL